MKNSVFEYPLVRIEGDTKIGDRVYRLGFVVDVSESNGDKLYKELLDTFKRTAEQEGE